MSLGAFTTTFVPVASCLSSLDNLYSEFDGPIFQGPVSVDDCFPANYKPSPSYFYSPGVCPSGDISACSSSSMLSDETETTVTCYPTFVLPRLYIYQVHKPPS